MKIRIGIAGYGNMGRGVELALAQNPDMELVGVFTRRDPMSVQPWGEDVAVYTMQDVPALAASIDVMILCGGSAADLPTQGPDMAQYVNTVDSFDTHARIPEYFTAVDAAAKSSGKVAVISAGWDPGLFSINRAYAGAVLPKGKGYTFWGKGVSQGHSGAIRKIEGVADAKQYSIPVQDAVAAARSGENPELSTRQKHLRECFVVAKQGANEKEIERQIVTMPHYFAEYDTTVHFISQEELDSTHAGLPHGGFVIHAGETGRGSRQVIEYSLQLDSNPEFTASVLVAYARAAARMNASGETGARTVLDIAPALLSAKSAQELRAELL